MKKKITILTALLSLFFVFNLNAQDINAALELYNAGALANQEGNLELSIENMNKALEMAQTLGEEGAELTTKCKNIIPTLYLSWAKELANNGDEAKALEIINKAIETSEAFEDVNNVAADARELIGIIHLKQANEFMNAKDFAKAIEGYKKVLDLNPENGTAALRLGMAYGASGDIDNAIACFEKAATLGQEANANKQLANIYLKRAAAAMKTKKWAEMFEAAQKATSLIDNAQATKLLGMSAIELKKYDVALEAYTKLSADTAAKDINTTYYKLAIANEGLGNKAEACKFYRKIITDPTFKAVAEYKIKTELKCE